MSTTLTTVFILMQLQFTFVLFSPDIRPITPPAEDRDTKERPSRTPRTSFRTVSTADTDLLFKLFDSVEKKHNKKPDAFQLKRGR